MARFCTLPRLARFRVIPHLTAVFQNRTNKREIYVGKISRSSAGLTIWQKRHMPRAPRFCCPRAYSLLFFSEFFGSMFQYEIQTVRHCGALKSPFNPPENARAPKFKKRVPIKLGPNGFCSQFQRGGPKSPRSSENIRTQKFKN